MKISKESCNKIFTVHIIIIKGSHLEFQEMKKIVWNNFVTINQFQLGANVGQRLTVWCNRKSQLVSLYSNRCYHFTVMNSRRPGSDWSPPLSNNIKISSQWVSSLSFCNFGKFCLGQMHSTGRGFVVDIASPPTPPPSYLGGFNMPPSGQAISIIFFHIRSYLVLLLNTTPTTKSAPWNDEYEKISCYQSGTILKLILYSSKLTVRLVLF